MIPVTVQSSTSPITMTAPGSANNNHADSPDALSEKAVIQGPKFLPAKKYSSVVFCFWLMTHFMMYPRIKKNKKSTSQSNVVKIFICIVRLRCLL